MGHNLELHDKGRVLLGEPSYLKVRIEGKKKIPLLIMIAEFVYIIRPVVYCNLLMLSGKDKTKSFIWNLLIDGLWIGLLIKQRGKVVLKEPIVRQRIKRILITNLLRNPLYSDVVRVVL